VRSQRRWNQLSLRGASRSNLEYVHQWLYSPLIPYTLDCFAGSQRRWTNSNEKRNWIASCTRKDDAWRLNLEGSIVMRRQTSLPLRGTKQSRKRLQNVYAVVDIIKMYSMYPTDSKNTWHLLWIVYSINTYPILRVGESRMLKKRRNPNGQNQNAILSRVAATVRLLLRKQLRFRRRSGRYRHLNPALPAPKEVNAQCLTKAQVVGTHTIKTILCNPQIGLFFCYSDIHL